MQRTWIKEAVNLVGQEIWLKGWVFVRRDMGKIIFIDLRDRSGVVQVVFTPEKKDLLALAAELRPEFVVAIRGRVNARPEKQINPESPTGRIEIEALELDILNRAKTPPFELDKDTSAVSEEIRLKYRYLDLRSERMKNNYLLRDRVISFCRDFLHREEFVEIETPILTKGTPEGAREYLVPARLHPGKVYVLPQSPQQFKQLLMVAGVERYFQIARCFRDEDQRGDRQPEFTQLDLEMDFVEREDVMDLIERLLIELVQATTPEKTIQEIPFPRLTYAEAMEKYGTDRPDLRQDKNDKNLLAFCWVIDFPFFEKTEEGGWTFTHNPFSAPKAEQLELLMTKKRIGDILTSQYDIILNGFEIGGGSIRNHDPEALRRVLEIIGLDQKTIEERFGHMLEAFAYGAPPHGGIAPGLDRLIMILAGEPNIREVIPFPKTGDARDLMMGAPARPDPDALSEVNVKFLT
jgi:aspartyl-tRNA synthetase